MNWHAVTKEFLDYAEDIEAVNIHYAWTLLGGIPDWEHQRITRYMPFVRTGAADSLASHLPGEGDTAPSSSKRRQKILRLPLHITDPESGLVVDQYLLHYYFEIFQSGYRHYTPLYTEEVVTGAGIQPLVGERLASALPTDTMTDMVRVTG